MVIIEKKEKTFMKLKLHKVQKISGALYICIPQFWARSFGINQGNILKMDLLSDGSILIQPQNQTGQPS
jgi:hypothetical protein